MSNGRLPRRILLLLPAAFGEFGGIQLYNRLLIKALTDIAHASGSACRIIILNDRASDIDRRYLAPNSAVHGCGASKARFLTAALMSLVRFQPDLVMLGHINLAPLAPLCRLVGARTSLFVYGVEFWRRLRPLTRASLKLVCPIISISEFTLREGSVLNGLRHDSFRLIPCALDPLWEQEFRPFLQKPHNGEPILLSVARLSESEKYKGLDHVIRALPAIAEQIPAVQYWIVGDGDDRERLETIARETGVAERVRFFGRVSVHDLGAAYGHAAVFVMPSAKEGFGIVFLEAAFFEIPSVGARFGGIPEVVDGETGALVDYGDVAQIASTLTELLLDRTKRERLGAAARMRLEEKFSFEQLRRRIENVVAGA